MNRFEYKMVQDVVSRIASRHLTNEGYNLIHDIKSEIGQLYSAKLRYTNADYEVYGFSIEDLLKVALLLKENHITPKKLKSVLDAFDCGMLYSDKLHNEAFNKYISKMFDDMTKKEGTK